VRAQIHPSVELLLEEGVETRSPLNNDEESPLHLAAGNGDAVCARMLLEYGADPNAVCASGENSLHIAVRIGDTETTTLLLDAPPASHLPGFILRIVSLIL
jgi:ankyrin repeat/SOCS box protein 7